MPPFIPVPDAPRERRSAPPIPRDRAGARAGAEEPPPDGEETSADPPSPDLGDDPSEPPGASEAPSAEAAPADVPGPSDGRDGDAASAGVPSAPDAALEAAGDAASAGVPSAPDAALEADADAAPGAPAQEPSDEEAAPTSAPASDPRARHAFAPLGGGVPVSPDDPVAEAPSSPAVVTSSPDRVLSRPVLASEALMEDLAPVEPLREHARVLCVAAGLVFAILGVLPRLGISPPGQAAFLPSEVVGAVTLFAAVARVTYRQRAVAMVALGAIVAILGVAGVGPARGIAHDGAGWSIARMAAAALLPATLLFRARYRAFQGARLLLGLAYLASLPFALHAVLQLTGSANPFGFVQIGAILALLSIAAGLPGFMGSETTAAGSFVAPVMIAAFAVSAGLERLGVLVPGSLADVFGVAQAAVEGAQTAVEGAQATGEEAEILQRAPSAVRFTAAALGDALVTAVAVGVSALLSAVGIFQILAWKFAPAARKIDVRRTADTPIEDRPSAEEWSTRH